MRRRPRTLRSRLFGWFLGAILLAIATGSVVAVHTRPEPFTPVETVIRRIGLRLAESWDDPARTVEYVDEVRDVTGLDVRLVRNPERLPSRVRRQVERRAVFTWDGSAGFTLPVIRDGAVVGALEFGRVAPRALHAGWWRFVLALALVVALLSAMGGAVADQLAKPLERLARAADRFGGGDLSARADVAGGEGRWVAREVRDVAVSFDRMAARVEALVRAERELLGAISHELRSPLGRARVALEIARDRASARGGPAAFGAEQKEAGSPDNAFDDVEKQLGAVDAILGDLLDGTRVGLSDVRRTPTPLLPWLRDRIADEPSPPLIRLHAAPEAAALVVSFDPALLARALHNLLQNARAHGHPQGEAIDVRLTQEGPAGEPRARLVVQDRGPGFPPGFAERAFEPFVRWDKARARASDQEGVGLGLTIVRRIVEAHGGRVFAGNRAGAAVPSAGVRTTEVASQGGEVGIELPLDAVAR